MPKQIREVLGVQPGDRVTFSVIADGSVRIAADTVDLMSLRGSIKSKVKGVTLEDMEAAIARGARGR